MIVMLKRAQDLFLHNFCQPNFARKGIPVRGHHSWHSLNTIIAFHSCASKKTFDCHENLDVNMLSYCTYIVKRTSPVQRPFRTEFRVSPSRYPASTVEKTHIYKYKTKISYTSKNTIRKIAFNCQLWSKKLISIMYVAGGKVILSAHKS